MNALSAPEPLNQADPPDLADVLPPTPESIDAAIAEYESAQQIVRGAQDVAEEAKQRLIFLVDNFGTMPAAATASRRLEGRHNEAIVTRGTTTAVNEDAVREFELFLEAKRKSHLFGRFFAVEFKHSIVDGARDVLKTIELPKIVEEKLYQLFGKCLTVKTKAPQLRVSVTVPEKPARKLRVEKAGAQ